MWLTEGCGGRRRAVVTPNRESRKEKKNEDNSLDILDMLVSHRTVANSYIKRS